MAGAAGRQRVSLLFVNKKKQKNFIHQRVVILSAAKDPRFLPATPRPPVGARANGKKFFGSFFQKRTCFLPADRI
jgi:hypothetical protein